MFQPHLVEHLFSGHDRCLQGENGFSAAGTAENEGGSISR
jgi:hypothetical protein